jgi:hypothetical protein
MAFTIWSTGDILKSADLNNNFQQRLGYVTQDNTAASTTTTGTEQTVKTVSLSADTVSSKILILVELKITDARSTSGSNDSAASSCVWKIKVNGNEKRSFTMSTRSMTLHSTAATANYFYKELIAYDDSEDYTSAQNITITANATVGGNLGTYTMEVTSVTVLGDIIT